MNIVSGGITATSLVALAVIVITLYEAFKPPEEEYEAPIGDNPEDDKDREDREDREREYATVALGRSCTTDEKCSASGKFGGRPSGALDRIHCDRGRCEFDRKDYTGILWFPPSKCIGDIFKGPGSCKESQEEIDLRDKLRREGEYESAKEPTTYAEIENNCY